jgi:hypothetical protein
VSSLVGMYAKCGSTEDSACSQCSTRCHLEVLSSWNAILPGSVCMGMVRESLDNLIASVKKVEES